MGGCLVDVSGGRLVDVGVDFGGWGETESVEKNWGVFLI